MDAYLGVHDRLPPGPVLAILGSALFSQRHPQVAAPLNSTRKSCQQLAHSIFIMALRQLASSAARYTGLCWASPLSGQTSSSLATAFRAGGIRAFATGVMLSKHRRNTGICHDTRLSAIVPTMVMALVICRPWLDQILNFGAPQWNLFTHFCFLRLRQRHLTGPFAVWCSHTRVEPFVCLIAVEEGLKYAKSHEWAKIEGDTATIGISDFAQVRSSEACTTARRSSRGFPKKNIQDDEVWWFACICRASWAILCTWSFLKSAQK